MVASIAGLRKEANFLFIHGWKSTFLLLGGGFKLFFFHPYLGKITNLTNIFEMG